MHHCGVLEAEGRVVGVKMPERVLVLLLSLSRENERLVVVATGGGNDNNKREREVTKGVCVYQHYQLDRRRIGRQLPCDDIG
jgi:hypothetical protein